MPEDDISRGCSARSILTGEPYDPVSMPSRLESVIASLPTGDGAVAELWKLNHYYERLDEWNAGHGIATSPSAGKAAEPLFEIHNLTVDPGAPQPRRRRARGPEPDAVHT